jgi:hypothetical protein
MIPKVFFAFVSAGAAPASQLHVGARPPPGGGGGASPPAQPRLLLGHHTRVRQDAVTVTVKIVLLVQKQIRNIIFCHIFANFITLLRIMKITGTADALSIRISSLRVCSA